MAIQSVTNTNHFGWANEQDTLQIISLLLKVDREMYHKNRHSIKLTHFRNRFGRTALHYSADLCSTNVGMKIFSLLINAGANIDDVDYKQRTPFYICLYHYKLNQWQVPNNWWHQFTQLMMTQFDCDSLNYNQLLYPNQVANLKQLCRQYLQSIYKKNFQFLQHKLPNELVDYLNRICLK